MYAILIALLLFIESQDNINYVYLYYSISYKIDHLFKYIHYT